jgi:sulfonate transport system ATP-binding protein
MNPLISLNNLGKIYGDKTALHDVNFSIYPGEFVALVGMSGGGKSTILRLIAQLEQPSSGKIAYAGSRLPVTRVMFQNDRLLPWMTALQNVSFNAHAAATQKQAQSALNSVGLSEFADSFPSQLSGGAKAAFGPGPRPDGQSGIAPAGRTARRPRCPDAAQHATVHSPDCG